MTQLQIGNLALGHLGMLPITQAQLTANEHPSAKAINLYWEPARDDVLGESDWSFASTSLALSALSITDSLWDYVYSTPTMSVGSIWNVFNQDTVEDKENQAYEVKHISTLGVSAIYTDLYKAFADFTYKVTDTSLWSNKFVMAFSYRLASMMAVSLTGDAARALSLMDVSNAFFSETKRVSSSEKIKKPYISSKYQDAR